MTRLANQISRRPVYGVISDVRDAFRVLRSTPIVTAVAILPLAGWLPARRASRLDPAHVLREG